MQHKKSSGVYFPGLNSLRFFAAATVWFMHSGVALSRFGFPRIIKRGLLHPYTDKLGVILFFVISGFLITYLLLTEKRHTGNISVWRFYIRRSLRIWPIYYLMVFLGFFVLQTLVVINIPNIQKHFGSGFNNNLALYIFLLPNFARFVPLIAHFWSLGTEEQFYAVWPWLHKFFKNTFLVCGAIIVLQLTGLFVAQEFAGSNFLLGLKRVLTHSRFDCMAIGGIFAALLFYDIKPLLRILMWRGTLVITFAVFMILYLLKFRHIVFGYSVFGLLFAIVILNIAANPKSLLRLEWKWTEYLGRISYGIYIYHVLAIYLVGIAATNFISPKGSSPELVWFLTLLSGLLTIGLSVLSYNYIEKLFLKMKPRFTIISSGDTAKNSSSGFCKQ
jgi:peptidoglycan/LPS O-acetylase OafA/YrhL